MAPAERVINWAKLRLFNGRSFTACSERRLESVALSVCKVPGNGHDGDCLADGADYQVEIHLEALRHVKLNSLGSGLKSLRSYFHHVGSGAQRRRHVETSRISNDLGCQASCFVAQRDMHTWDAGARCVSNQSANRTGIDLGGDNGDGCKTNQ